MTIYINNLSLAFGEKVILKNIEWRIGERARVGLVGDNGTGKTTLLRLLAGESAPDSGSVSFDKGAVIGYTPQELAELGEGTIMTYLRDRAGISDMQRRLDETAELISETPQDSPRLPQLLAEHDRTERLFALRGGYDFDAASMRALRGLGFKAGDARRDVREFSGGWRVRIALAGAILLSPSVLLLDEPTNHLDTESTEWLEGWINSFAGTLIFVSHDRRFFEHTAEEIAELARGSIAHYRMSYDEYLSERGVRIEQAGRAAEERREFVERTERFIERFRYKASKAAQVQSRMKQLEKLEKSEPIAAIAAPVSSKHVSFKFPEAARSGLDVLKASGLSKSYDELIFSGLSFNIQRGERVALVGVNGAGKSTLMRLISGIERPDTGEIKFGHNVKMAYFSQESSASLSGSRTVWEEARAVGSKMLEADRRNLLGAFLFSDDDIKKQVSVLSGGEKSRLALFKLLLGDANFLILDEPANHLDTATRERLQTALVQFGGTILIVSHDRYFLDNLADRIFEIRDGELRDYRGNYSDFIRTRALTLKENSPSAAAPIKTSGEKINSRSADTAPDQRGQAPPNESPRERRRREAEERNALKKARAPLETTMADVENEIAELETRRSEIDDELCKPIDGAAIRGLSKERSAIEERLGKLYEEWEKLV
ncbi:ABC transporter ATP-binding protein [Synergistales bacterium]|nr:ABC transporter ATP-binding protein [Synergistales bacterium]